MIRINSILAATDLSPQAGQAIERAAPLATGLGRERLEWLILGFEDMIKSKFCSLCACPPCAASTTSSMKKNGDYSDPPYWLPI